MSKRWYGSIENRLEEGRQFCEEIKVGTGVTEYSWSDRHPYEVTEVTDQKHIKIRKMDHKHIGDGHMDNSWELISNENHPEIPLVKRGSVWYIEKIATLEDLESENFERRLWVAMSGFDPEKIRAKGFQKKYSKMNISIGVADYYYDYSF